MEKKLDTDKMLDDALKKHIGGGCNNIKNDFPVTASEKNRMMKELYSILKENSINHAIEKVDEYITTNKFDPDYHNKLIEISKKVDRLTMTEANNYFFKAVGRLFDFEIKSEIFKNGLGIKNKKQKTGKLINSFESTLTEPQIQKLFDELKSDKNGFIYSETTFEQFTAIFNADIIERTNRVKWIDKPDKSNSIINTKTLFEFLYLLRAREKINTDNFETGSHNNNNFYKKINHCFSDANGNDIKDLKSKCSHKAEQNTPRKKLLAEIVTNSIK